MTTLFNLFCPMVLLMKVSLSLLIMIVLTMGVISLIILNLKMTVVLLFSNFILIVGAILFTGFNLISLVCYSFPVTTVLAFNFMVALSLWLASVILLFLKSNGMANILPANSPWYLVPFLSLVELVSLLVRPITLSFRLLANMSAGHILLSLICKMNSGLWLIGSVFVILELMVCIVQAFVFYMLVSVYLEEGFTH